MSEIYEIIGNTTATPNPQADWEQTNAAKPDYIKNKPKVLTEAEVIDLIGEHGGDTQIQADWKQDNQDAPDYIHNKPEILTKEEIENLINTSGGGYTTRLNVHNEGSIGIDGDNFDAIVASKAPEGGYISGDTFIIKTLISEDKYSYTAYVYDGASWRAMDGNYNAENVYFDENLITTTAVGNITLSNGQATIDAQGKNLKQVFEAIFVKEETGNTLQKTAPSLTIDGDETKVELGSKVIPTYETTFNPGAYKYGPATGITAKNYKVTNNLTDEELTVADGGFAEYQFEEVKSFKVSASCDYTQGDIPKSNLGNDVADQRFAAKVGLNATAKTLYSSYKPNFYGFITDASKKLTTLDATTLTNDFIRGLTNQGSTTTPLTSVEPNAKWIQFIYAIPVGRKSSMSAQDDVTKLPCAKATKHENIIVTHQNDVTSTYTVFVISNDALADANKMNLTWTA